MAKYFYIISFLAIAVFSCSPTHNFKKDKAAFDASKITRSFVSVADMNDAHFDIKENGFFDFYRQLFDSVKNTRYPGRFELRNDTMHLKFYDKRGMQLLGTKAVIDENKDQIIFFK